MNIDGFWKSVLAQDAAAIREYFHPGAVIRWHCTDEQFSVEEYVRANCEYPGEWDGEIERVTFAGDLCITACSVYPKDRSASFHVASFIRIEDGKITAMDEYWADDGPAPRWRQEMNIGTKIREALP